MGRCWGSWVFAPGDAHSNGSRLAAQLEPVLRGQSLEPEHLPGPGRDQFGRHHQQHYWQVRERAFSPGLRTGLPVSGQSWNDNDIQDAAHGLKSLFFTNFEAVDLSPAVTNLSPTQAGAGASVTISGRNYSGAAGRLSVWFGSNQVPATLTDDAHVTAIAPPSSGTVNVRVQSGLSNANSSANYTSPIWGYGLSMTSSVARFTYQSLDPFHAWLAAYGLPSDGSADYLDSDGDGLNNRQEFHPQAFAQGGMCRNMGLTARRNPFAINRMRPRPCDQAVPLPCPFLLPPAVPGAPHNNGLL
jgi:hypothetical protein